MKGTRAAGSQLMLGLVCIAGAVVILFALVF
jgi:hypothetical protein